MRVYEHPKHGWTHQELGIGNVRNKDNAINLESLAEVTAEAESLAEELYEIFGQIHNAVNGN